MTINPIRVVEEVVRLGIDLNVLPAAVVPSAWYKMHSWLFLLAFGRFFIKWRFDLLCRIEIVHTRCVRSYFIHHLLSPCICIVGCTLVLHLMLHDIMASIAHLLKSTRRQHTLRIYLFNHYQQLPTDIFILF